MARMKRIGKLSNRDRALKTLVDMDPEPFKREQFVMKAKAHSERAGEAWSKRTATSIENELDTLLAEGLATWDENREECKVSEETRQVLARHKLSDTIQSLSPRDAYLAESRHWRAIFPPTKRKTRFEYMWEYIMSRGRIHALLGRIAALVKEKEEQNKIIVDLQRRLAERLQSERAVALPTPGPSTPTPHAVDAYPTPRSEADVEESPLLLSSTLPSVRHNRAPLTPMSNPRLILKRRTIHGVPPTPSPLARQVPIYADVDASTDAPEADDSMSMSVHQLGDLQGADDSMVLDDPADSTDEDKDDELSDIELDDHFEPLAGSPWNPRAGKGVFLRVTDAFGNFVGDLFTPGRARSVGLSAAQGEPLDEILPELSTDAPAIADAAYNNAGTSSGPAATTVTVVPAYCSRAVSPISTSPDPREMEIKQLKEAILHLRTDLEVAQHSIVQKDTRIEDLQRQIANKERRLQLLMNLHAQMDAEFEKERAGH